MTLSEVMIDVKNIINETDIDEQIDSIIKTAILSCYTSELARVDKRLNTAYTPIVNGIATLPSDLLSVYKITPELTSSDKHLGSTILTDKSGVFTIIYTMNRERLVNDTDEFDLADSLTYALVMYGACAYFNYRKKLEVAQWYKAQYDEMLRNYEYESGGSEEHVVDIYSGGGEI